MPLFVCSKCQTIENTALCGYWWRGKKKPLCSLCDKEFKKWHNRFPREKFNPKKWKIDCGDFIKLKDTDVNN